MQVCTIICFECVFLSYVLMTCVNLPAFRFFKFGVWDTYFSTSRYSKSLHRIINVHNLQSTVHQFLGICHTYKSMLRLEKKGTLSFTTKFEIVCKRFNQNENKDRQKMRNMKRIIKNMKHPDIIKFSEQRSHRYMTSMELSKRRRYCVLKGCYFQFPIKKLSKIFRIRSIVRQGSL